VEEKHDQEKRESLRAFEDYKQKVKEKESQLEKDY